MNLKISNVLEEVFYFFFNYVVIIGKWYFLVIDGSGFMNVFVMGILIIIVRDVVVVMVMVIVRIE